MEKGGTRMNKAVERELLVPETPEEVWSSLAEPAWLGEDASIELEPAGDVRAGERSGFVEEADQPHRLVFWWSGPDEEASRVELQLEPVDEGTIVRVTESRPLEMLTMRGRDLAVELDLAGGAGPVASAAAGGAALVMG
jgi:uncharacterized protein YndB with AHSA1/START domain